MKKYLTAFIILIQLNIYKSLNKNELANHLNSKLPRMNFRSLRKLIQTFKIIKTFEEEESVEEYDDVYSNAFDLLEQSRNNLELINLEVNALPIEQIIEKKMTIQRLINNAELMVIQAQNYVQSVE